MTSPETRDDNRGRKLLAYKAIDSVAAVVFVDPLDRTIEQHDRVAPNEWRHRLLPPESGVGLREPAIELSFAEIFAVD